MDLTHLPVGANVTLLAAGAAAVWLAGIRLASVVDDVAVVTGLRRAFLGALLLGSITSLPEAATMMTASVLGAAPLAAGNLFGSASTNMVILATADLVSRRPIARTVPARTVVLQGTAVIVLLGIAAAGIVLGDPLDARVGAWPLVLAVAVVITFLSLRRSSDDSPTPPAPSEPRGETSRPRRLVLVITAIAVVVILAGTVTASAGNALTAQLGLGSTFVGFVLLAISTSLPEISATYGAVRIGRPQVAVANVFGTNIANMALLLAADVAYPRGPIVDALGRADLLSVAIAAAAVLGYVGPTARRWVTAHERVGVGSVLAIVVYVGGTAVLFAVR